MRRPFCWPLCLLLIAVQLAILPAAAHGFSFADIEQHWARDSIRRLAEAGFLHGYTDGRLQPDKPITRAEFAQIAVPAFALPEGLRRVFADAQGHPAANELSIMVDHGAYRVSEDATIQPEATLTRGETGQAVIALLGLSSLSERLKIMDTPRFEDVPADHAAFGSLQLAARLNIFPPFLRGRLSPEEPVTRGEAAFILDQALRLEQTSGRVERLDSERRVLWLSAPNGTERSFPVTDLDIITQDGWNDWQTITPGTQLHLISNRFGRPLVAWAEPQTAYEGLLGTLQGLAAALLTPEQLQAVINGEWEQAGEALKLALYGELLNYGIRPWEAEAMLAQDWNSLQELGRRRLAEAAASYLNVSPDLAFSLLDQDWTSARDHAQREALERLIQEYLFTPAHAESSQSRKASTQPTSDRAAQGRAPREGTQSSPQTALPGGGPPLQTTPGF